MTTIIILAVVIIAAVVVARMVFARESDGTPPPLPEEPSLSSSPSFVPRPQRHRSSGSAMASPPPSILGLPTDPARLVTEDDEWVLYQKLLERVGDRARVDRLIEFEQMNWPLATRRDWIIRAEQRLDTQSQR
jgi:hypothetical protein